MLDCAIKPTTANNETFAGSSAGAVVGVGLRLLRERASYAPLTRLDLGRRPNFSDRNGSTLGPLFSSSSDSSFDESSRTRDRSPENRNLKKRRGRTMAGFLFFRFNSGLEELVFCFFLKEIVVEL